MKMIERVLIFMLAMLATSYGTDYNIDSSNECDDTSNYEVDNWETVHVKGGRAMDSYYTKSTKSTCKISLHADKESSSRQTLKIKVEKAVFDNDHIQVKIYDGSHDFSSELKMTLDKYSTSYSTFETTQPYAYIVVDKTQCPDNAACRHGFELDLKVTMSDGESGGDLSTAALIGIIIGAILGFCLLIGVTICCCCRSCIAASNRARRRGQNVTAATTYGVDEVYQTRQFVITATTVSPRQATSDNQTGTTQDCNSAMAPPPYPGNQPVHNPYLQQTYPQQQQGQLNPAM